jgi:hypothetical protein
MISDDLARRKVIETLLGTVPEPEFPRLFPFLPTTNPSYVPPTIASGATARQTILRARLPVQPDMSRLAYFAFDFDDLMRVNNVRQSGKIGPRTHQGSRGFKDRSVWEKSSARTKTGLKMFMQRAVKGSGLVCVLIGTDTWKSFWVRYEIALAVIGERGLLAVDLNSLRHHDRQVTDPLGVNPLQFMGVHRHTDGNWYLVERCVTETSNGPAFEWHWYQEYKQQVKRPAYIRTFL